MRSERTPLKWWSAKSAALLGSGAAMVLALSAGPAGAATSPNSNTGGSGSAAVVTPLLEFFIFGNTIGFPLLCSDAGSVISIIGTESGSPALSSPLVNELDKECATLSSAGNGFFAQAVSESKALTLINPVVNPVIQDLANGLTSAGTQFGPSLAPFGPTVAGLGGTVAFFEGS